LLRVADVPTAFRDGIQARGLRQQHTWKKLLTGATRAPNAADRRRFENGTASDSETYYESANRTFFTL